MSTHPHHATGRCPYCGTAFDEQLPHQMHLVNCRHCAKAFVALVSYSTDVRRVEGEASRYTGVNVSAINSYKRVAA